MKKLCIALLSLGMLACKPDPNKAPTPTSTSTTQAPDKAKPVIAESKPTSAPSMVTIVEKPKAEATRYEKPTERRLYPSRAESDEILNQEMHPFYLLDNDEKTGWGYTPEEEYVSEVKLRLSEVEGATQVRLRIKAAGTERGHPKELTITASPGRQTMTAALAMTDDWQEILFDLTTAKLAAEEPDSAPTSAASTPTKPASAPAEIKVNYLTLDFSDAQKPKAKEEEKDPTEEEEDYEDYESDWRDYVEVKEIEIFVTGLTKENPAFEKSRLEHILTWKKTRAASFKTRGTPLPIATEYKSTVMQEAKADDEDDEDDEDYGDSYYPPELSHADAFESLQKYLPSYAASSVARAQQALASEKKSWVPLQVASLSLKPYQLPAGAIGAAPPPSYVSDYEYASEFFVPDFAFGTLLLQEQLTITESKAKERPEDCDQTEEALIWRRSEIPAEKPSELIIERCLHQEDRGGTTLFRITEVIEYDDKGRVQLWVTPYSIQWFDWKDTDKGGHLAGVIRLTNTSITRFIDATNDAPPLNDDRPWLVLTSSKPLFDADSEKEINELKTKLAEAGFPDAESFDSRQAKSLSCCFMVLTAGRFKTKKEAQATAKKVKAKGFEAYVKQGW